MTSSIINREKVLNKVKELKASNTKPDESLNLKLDLELAGLYGTLPMKWLTSSMLIAGTAYIGFLYNHGAGMYVCVDSDNKWLFATRRTIERSVRWKLYLDSLGNLVLNATIGVNQMYFNWRNSTGACKLYHDYDRMTAKDWAETQFKLFNPSNSEYIGTWSNKDYELYNRKKVSYTQFGFEFFDEPAFTQDDYLIYSTYLKELNGPRAEVTRLK